MTKRMREIQAKIHEKTEAAKGFMVEGEGRDLVKAEALLNEIDELQKEYDLEARMEERNKAGVPENAAPTGKVDGFLVMAKMLKKKALDEREKAALISGDDATQGENYLVPDDVKAEVNELRKTYVSAKNLVTVVTTDALAGSVNYEAGEPAGLLDFEDGEAIGEEDGIKFEQRPFKIGWKGKLIPISRILLGANLCPDASDRLSFAAEGAVRFHSVCNGDQTSLESFVRPTMNAFGGQLVVVVEAVRRGKGHLRVTADGLKAATVGFEVK